jgi:hypothetical protein
VTTGSYYNPTDYDEGKIAARQQRDRELAAKAAAAKATAEAAEAAAKAAQAAQDEQAKQQAEQAAALARKQQLDAEAALEARKRVAAQQEQQRQAEKSVPSAVISKTTSLPEVIEADIVEADKFEEQVIAPELPSYSEPTPTETFVEPTTPTPTPSATPSREDVVAKSATISADIARLNTLIINTTGGLTLDQLSAALQPQFDSLSRKRNELEQNIEIFNTTIKANYERQLKAYDAIARSIQDKIDRNIYKSQREFDEEVSTLGKVREVLNEYIDTYNVGTGELQAQIDDYNNEYSTLVNGSDYANLQEANRLVTAFDAQRALSGQIPLGDAVTRLNEQIKALQFPTTGISITQDRELAKAFQGLGVTDTSGLPDTRVTPSINISNTTLKVNPQEFREFQQEFENQLEQEYGIQSTQAEVNKAFIESKGYSVDRTTGEVSYRPTTEGKSVDTIVANFASIRNNLLIPKSTGDKNILAEQFRTYQSNLEEQLLEYGITPTQSELNLGFTSTQIYGKNINDIVNEIVADRNAISNAPTTQLPAEEELSRNPFLRFIQRIGQAERERSEIEAPTLGEYSQASLDVFYEVENATLAKIPGVILPPGSGETPEESRQNFQNRVAFISNIAIETVKSLASKDPTDSDYQTIIDNAARATGLDIKTLGDAIDIALSTIAADYQIFLNTRGSEITRILNDPLASPQAKYQAALELNEAIQRRNDAINSLQENIKDLEPNVVGRILRTWAPESPLQFLIDYVAVGTLPSAIKDVARGGTAFSRVILAKVARTGEQALQKFAVQESELLIGSRIISTEERLSFFRALSAEEKAAITNDLNYILRTGPTIEPRLLVSATTQEAATVTSLAQQTAINITRQGTTLPNSFGNPTIYSSEYNRLFNQVNYAKTLYAAEPSIARLDLLNKALAELGILVATARNRGITIQQLADNYARAAIENPTIEPDTKDSPIPLIEPEILPETPLPTPEPEILPDLPFIEPDPFETDIPETEPLPDLEPFIEPELPEFPEEPIIEPSEPDTEEPNVLPTVPITPTEPTIPETPIEPEIPTEPETPPVIEPEPTPTPTPTPIPTPEPIITPTPIAPITFPGPFKFPFRYPQTLPLTQPATPGSEPEYSPDTQPQVSPFNFPQIQPETQPQVQPQSQLTPEAQAELEFQAQLSTQLQPQVQPQPKLQPFPQPRVEPLPQLEPQPKLELRPQSRVLNERVYFKNELDELENDKKRRKGKSELPEGFEIIRITSRGKGQQGDFVSWEILKNKKKIADYGPFTVRGILFNAEILTENAQKNLSKRFNPGKGTLRVRTKGDDLALALVGRGGITVEEVERLLPFRVYINRSYIRNEVYDEQLSNEELTALRREARSQGFTIHPPVGQLKPVDPRIKINGNRNPKPTLYI